MIDTWTQAANLWHNWHFVFSKYDLEVYMTLTIKVKLLNLIIIHYNFVINRWIVFRLGKNNTWGQDIEHQTELDLDLYMTLTVKVKLLNLAKLQ